MPGPVTEIPCWAHGRRKFFELADIAASKGRGKNAPPISPLAMEAVKRIDALFDIERSINGETAERRLAVRREQSAPPRTQNSTPCGLRRMLTEREHGRTCTVALAGACSSIQAGTLPVNGGRAFRFPGPLARERLGHAEGPGLQNR